MIRFTIKGCPVGKARARTVVHGGIVRSYTPKKTANWERVVAWECKKAAQGHIFAAGTPLKLDAWFYMPVAKSAPKYVYERLTRGEWNTNKPDIDNLLKSILDGCNGIAYEDDNQIAAVVAHKTYSDCPRVEVIIEQLKERV